MILPKHKLKSDIIEMFHLNAHHARTKAILSILSQDHQREIFPALVFLLADTSEEKSPSGTKDQIQNQGHMPGFICFNPTQPTAQQHMTLNQEKSHVEKGKESV